MLLVATFISFGLLIKLQLEFLPNFKVRILYLFLSCTSVQTTTNYAPYINQKPLVKFIPGRPMPPLELRGRSHSELIKRSETGKQAGVLVACLVATLIIIPTA